ncbi:MAG TPA: serine/threonine-protein kinase [Abditibacteriaceae bacterium]|jgi:serine/threonine-protein kinase
MEIGSQIGLYRVEALLGRGGMAKVYKVWHSGLARHEAMKVLSPQMNFDRSFIERFLQEARTAGSLRHANIATIWAVSESAAPQPYFTMELLEDGDLGYFMHRREKFSLPEALPILRQMAAALDYAHSKGVIHYDFKPGNVMLQKEGADYVVKLVDFGITPDKRLTGFPEYKSPEQLGSSIPLDHRTDQYSLAWLTYEMLCGRMPFDSLLALMKHEVIEPITRFPSLPEAANATILKALAKSPDERFASCGEFVEALDEAAPGHVIIDIWPAKTNFIQGFARRFLKKS